jgi:diguanylate cyclase (GGDEF)-like protein/putative nucleotidyltransferase with HDIG domain
MVLATICRMKKGIVMSNKPRPHLLVADNEETDIARMKEILKKKYTVSVVGTGELATDYALKTHPELILIAKTLPDGEAVEVIRKIAENADLHDVPVILILNAEEADSDLSAYEGVVADFVVKPVIPSILLTRVSHMLEFHSLHHSQAEEKQKEWLNPMSLQTIITIAQTIDARDRYAKGHSIRVALFCREIAAKMGWSEKEIEDLYHTALLHDIGKVAVEDSIFNKTTDLTEQEYDEVKRHTTVGSEMVKNIRFIPDVENGVRYHHEHYDGSGYAHVKGENIPMVARIIAVADAYEAMTSDRAFRKSMSVESARHELERGKGRQFDPAIVDVFLSLLDEGMSVDVKSVEKELSGEEEAEETGSLLRQVFHETMQEVQSGRERDSLTGFLQRQYFEEKVNVYLQNPNASGAFFMMDMDEFKLVNDTYGHVMGDNLIQAFSEVIKKNIREDDYVCRMGGDEFAIFFPEMVKESVVRKRAESMIQSFAEKRKEIGCDVSSVSIGIMIKHPMQEIADCTALYDYADKALYYVKNNGKDTYYMYANIPEEAKNGSMNFKQMDLSQLMQKIAERKYHRGAYAVQYDRFAHIFQFVSRNIERSRQQVQVILFSLEKKNGVEGVTEEKMEDALMLLETAIIRSLRRGDVTTRLSMSQQIVILMDTDSNNGKLVANRILDKYRKLTEDRMFEITYDITEIPVKKAAEKTDN